MTGAKTGGTHVGKGGPEEKKLGGGQFGPCLLWKKEKGAKPPQG